MSLEYLVMYEHLLKMSRKQCHLVLHKAEQCGDARVPACSVGLLLVPGEKIPCFEGCFVVILFTNFDSRRIDRGKDTLF